MVLVSLVRVLRAKVLAIRNCSQRWDKAVQAYQIGLAYEPTHPQLVAALEMVLAHSRAHAHVSPERVTPL